MHASPPFPAHLPRRRTPRRRAAARTAAAVVAAALAGLSGVALVAAPASAHASLVRVVPADGSTVTDAPTQVRLVFDEAVRNPPSVVVTGPSGRVSTGSAKAVDNTVTVAVDLSARPGAVGRYSVAYRVVSADGHPVAGEAAFEFRPPGVAAAGRQAAAQRQTQAQDDPDASRWLVAGVLVVVAVAAVLLLAPRRRR